MAVSVQYTARLKWLGKTWMFQRGEGERLLLCLNYMSAFVQGAGRLRSCVFEWGKVVLITSKTARLGEVLRLKSRSEKGEMMVVAFLHI